MPHHLFSKKHVASFLVGASILGTTVVGLLHSQPALADTQVSNGTEQSSSSGTSSATTDVVATVTVSVTSVTGAPLPASISVIQGNSAVPAQVTGDSGNYTVTFPLQAQTAETYTVVCDGPSGRQTEDLTIDPAEPTTQTPTVHFTYTIVKVDNTTPKPNRILSLGSKGYIDTGLFTWQQTKQTETNHVYLSQTDTSYDIYRAKTKLGTATLTEDTIDNGDTYYMVHYLPYQSSKVPFTFNIHLTGQTSNFTERYTTYPHGVQMFNLCTVLNKSTLHNATKLPMSTVMLDGTGHSLMLSRADVYTEDANQTLLVHNEKVIPTTYANGTFHFSMPNQKGLIDEQWAVLSNQSLVDWNSPFVVATIRRGDFNQQQKWTSQGPMILTYDSYEPHGGGVYWYDPAVYATKSYVGNWGATRLFYSFGLVQLYDGVLPRQNSQGYFPTTPESDLLYREFGIGKDFYDTRLNTDSEVMMISLYSRFKDPAILNSITEYANYLENYAQMNSFRTKNEGVLVWDYADPRNAKLEAHTSLNHDLAQMNFLYEYYLMTNDKQALQVAELYKTGIDDTGTAWIKPSGDLYYDRSVDGVFEGDDYPTVTLFDLQKTHTLFDEVYDQTDGQIEQLITSKTHYLDETYGGIPS